MQDLTQKSEFSLMSSLCRKPSSPNLAVLRDLSLHPGEGPETERDRQRSHRGLSDAALLRRKGLQQ